MDQHFVSIAVVKRNAVGDDVVYIHIPRLKESGAVQLRPRVQTDSVLLLIEFELDQILSRGARPLYRFDLRHERLVLPVVFLVFLVNFLPFLQIIAHFAGQFNHNALG